MTEIAQHHRDELDRAINALENPGFIARLTNFLGMPLEKAIKGLPERAGDLITNAARGAIEKALGLALRTLKEKRGASSANRFHKALVGTSGFAGGMFGLPALAVELPVSTTIMLRSIADIAQSEGEELSAIETKLACIEVFALGGNRSSDDAVDTGYYAVRATLARALAEAAQFIAHRGLAQEGAPVIVRIVALIASRFSATVSEKIVAQAVPAIGALGGATINVLFMEHFQQMARGHFIIRRLERIYGAERVKTEYEERRKYFERARSKS
ncbi:MAG TPA: EcsC family protein [Bacteroidota bacterium]